MALHYDKTRTNNTGSFQLLQLKKKSSTGRKLIELIKQAPVNRRSEYTEKKKAYETMVGDFLSPKVDAKQSLIYVSIKFVENSPKIGQNNDYMNRSIVGDNQSLDEGFKFKDIREQKDAEDNLSDDTVDYKGTMHTQESSKTKGRVARGNTT